MRQSLVVSITMFLLAGGALAAAASRPAQSQPAAKACVALLEAEYITPDVRSQPHELTGWLDTVLTESLSHQKGIVLVDRQALDKVLAEKKLTGLDAGTADAEIKPFIASGVLICPTIVVDAKTGKAIVTVQAVLAQRGTLLAEVTVEGKVAGDAWQAAPDLVKPLKEFWAQMRRRLETDLSLPSLEVRRISLSSKLARLQWMADDLTDALTVVPREGFALLVPRQPIHTKEERLLRLMGLSSPAGDDKSAKLSAVGDFQLSGELAEEVKSGVAFDQTPIKIALRVSHGGKDLARTEFAGKVGQYSKLQQQALTWSAKHFSRIAKLSARPLDESHAKAMTQEELAIARRLATTRSGSAAMDRDRQERQALAALRAAHLDPTCEEAALFVVQSIDGLYESRGQRETLACWDRVLSEGQKYLDRFGDRIPEHHFQVLWLMCTAGFRGEGLQLRSPRQTQDILSPPDERRWPYIRAYSLGLMEIGVRAVSNSVYARTNALQSMSGNMRAALVPNIPEVKLDEEYRFWREFWRKRVEPLGDDKCIPWDCVEMGFAARRKDPRAVRAAAQRLAAKYPKTRTIIWRLMLDDAVSLYLRAAGDKDWRTWQPTFPKGSPPAIDYYVSQRFEATWRLPMPTACDYSKAVTLPAVAVGIAAKGVVELGVQNYLGPYPKVECFMVAGGDAWFAGPCMYYHRHAELPQHLMVAAVKGLIGRDAKEAALVEVPWPQTPQDGATSKQGEQKAPYITCWQATAGSDGGDTVWIGTKDRGLARFDKKDGKWAGRWYASRQGMPSESIISITPFRSGDRRKLLLVGGGPRDGNGTKLFTWSLDIQSGQVKLLTDMAAAYHMGTLTAVWPDGRQIPLSAYSEAGDKGLDLEKVREIVPTGTKYPDCPGDIYELRSMRAGAAPRLWQIGEGICSGIQEMSPATLEPLPSPVISSVVPGWNRPHAAPTPFCTLAWYELGDGMPMDSPLDMIGSHRILGQDIWMLVKPYSNMNNGGDGTCLMVYRPAAQGDKDWASHDQWLGPFKPPWNGPIFGMASDSAGDVWLTGAHAVCRVDAKTLLEQARKDGRALTTAQWRQDFEKRLQKADWRVRFRMMVARRQFKEALALVETTLAGIGADTAASDPSARQVWAHAMLNKAFVLACLERWDDSLAAYSQVRKAAAATDPAQGFAVRGVVYVLAVAGRWKEFLAEVEAQHVKYDESDELYRYVRRARNELDIASHLAVPQTRPATESSAAARE